MEVVKIQEKGKHLNTLEKYPIYRVRKQGIQLNNNYKDIHNPIFKVIYDFSRCLP
jgi:hypothetical protein